MDTNTRIRQTVFSALDELNEQLPPSLRLEKDDRTPLTGPDGPLDSLNVVNLVAALEQKIEERLATTVDLIDNGLFDETQPLQNVGTLVTFVSAVVNGRAHA
jgi:acyl carrier protein